MIELKVVGRGSRYFDSVGVRHQTLKSYLHLLPLPKRLLYEVGLALKEYQLFTWDCMVGVEL